MKRIAKRHIEFDIITAVPQACESYLNTSMMRKAREKKYITVHVHNLHDYAHDAHRTVDDRPYGGGPGMILKLEPIIECMRNIYPRVQKATRIIMLTPAGEQFTQTMAYDMSMKYKRLILICGHYEGVDERVMNLVDECISVGPYVLTGGELPALTIIDAVARLIPGVLGNDASLLEETNEAGAEYPQYTRPESYSPKRGVKWDVPAVLLSGNHGEIRAWRKGESKQSKYKRGTTHD